MDDRELLILAAKAVGLSGRWNEPFQWLDLDDAHTKGMARTAWNPLADDGDALRLVTKLFLHVLPGDVFTEVIPPGPYNLYNGEKAIERNGDDRDAATRRAVVRAAAMMSRDK